MEKYNINHLKNKTFELFCNKEAVKYLKKWSLLDGLHLYGFAFNEPYQPAKIKDLFTAVLQHSRLLHQDTPEIPEGSLVIEPVPCTVTSLEFFDRLRDPANGIVNRSGDGGIRGCFEEIFDNFVVGDELRQMLLNEASVTFPLYSNKERKELLFCLLQHIVLGGQLCQYEDMIDPYIETSLVFYKTLLNVQKDENGDLQIRSKCFKVVFPEGSNIQDFIYFLVDPGLREITLLTHKF